MELAPYPFGALVRRMFRELDARRSIFDLPLRRAVLGVDGRDVSVWLHGRRAATPFGPAAGPHSQLAQNIVLSWLAGGRVIELKTVQVRDDLTIPRPCIDMATVGYNVEWSQELRVEQSLEEYVKALVLIRLLVESGRLPLATDFDDTVMDLSVGYDLAGLQSPKIEAFLHGIGDIRSRSERLRRDIPADWAPLRDVPLPERLTGSVTLSTFHGCPPGEIAAMALHLMRAHGLHVVVKLNPTLLGPRETRVLLHDVLGYRDLRVPDHAFTDDTSWDQMLALADTLTREARSQGLGFGLKLTNTLIVENHRSFFPAGTREMYLSGPPLHVLAIELLRRVRRALGPELPLSFSAGVDATNFPDVVALGLVPVTVCTDFLKPGGYGRGLAYFHRLGERMDASGVSSLGDFVIKAFGHGAAALAAVSLEPDERRAAEAALLAGTPLRAGVGDVQYRQWQRHAAALNIETYADRVVADARYHAASHAKTPRKIGRHLHLFDCLTCDKCVPVCPNDAVFTFVVPRTEWIRVKLTQDDAGWRREEDGVLRIAEKHQIGIYADFCNDCGNCDVFCPEDGGPQWCKPLFFGSETAWRRAAPIDGFVVSREDGRDIVLGRFRGRDLRLEVAEHLVRYSGPGFDVSFDEDDPETSIRGHADPGVAVELVHVHVMLALLRALNAPGAVNYVNCLNPAGAPP